MLTRSIFFVMILSQTESASLAPYAHGEAFFCNLCTPTCGEKSGLG